MLIIKVTLPSGIVLPSTVRPKYKKASRAQVRSDLITHVQDAAQGITGLGLNKPEDCTVLISTADSASQSLVLVESSITVVPDQLISNRYISVIGNAVDAWNAGLLQPYGQVAVTRLRQI